MRSTSDAIQVKYQPLSRPEPIWRWVEPHGTAFGGFRWHTRAFCQNKRVLKDFMLSRIVEIGKQGPVTADPQADTDWHIEVVLEIGQNRDLQIAQPRSIEMDYGMEKGRAQIAAWRFLLFHALKLLGLDTDPAARRPKDQQIILLNRKETSGDVE